MKILVTGAGGFLGRALCAELRNANLDLRSMDFVPFEGEPGEEVFIGDVSDPDAISKAMEGVDGLVIAHMAPRKTKPYNTTAAFDINVKGTGLLFEAAVKYGVKRIVLISTAFSVKAPESITTWREFIPPTTEAYTLTKSLQEFISRQYSACHELSISILRPGYVLCADKMEDKYGRPIGERVPVFSERRDIGVVAALCLKADDIVYEIFTVMSTPESMIPWDNQYTCNRLNWTPRFDFNHLPAQPKQ